MNRAAKQYLRQVKRHLCCPSSRSREFLRQLENDILLFCEKEHAGYPQISEHFGIPKDVAADFLDSLDPKEVSCFAYSRLRVSYLVTAVILVVFLGIVIPTAIAQTRENYSFMNAYYEESIVKYDPGEIPYDVWVHTVFNGEDVYWAYYAEERQWKQIPKPTEDADTEQSALGSFMSTENGWIQWEYDSQKNEWFIVEEYIE